MTVGIGNEWDPGDPQNIDDPSLPENELQVEEFPGHRVLKPGASAFKMAADSVSKLSKEELGAQINTYKILLQDAMATVDIRRTKLALAQNEMEYREQEELRRARSYAKPYNVGNTIKMPMPAKLVRKSGTELFLEQVKAWRAEGLSDQDIALRVLGMVKK